MQTGIANVPLHGGQCPSWLFEKMKQLGSAMVEAIVLEYGPSEILRRLSDPVWFQTFGSVLGFDWHSSGLTTVVCGALKEGLSKNQGELGVFFAGGKGKASRKTPLEIVEAGEKYGLSNDLVALQGTSRLVAKVDSAAVQDGYQLYHHFFVFDRAGNWAVIQQGMNEKNRYARRYHWLSENLQSFVEDPHSAVCGLPETDVLNLVYHDNKATRKASVALCRERPEQVSRIYQSIAAESYREPDNRQLSLFTENYGASSGHGLAAPMGGRLIMTMPKQHPIPSAKHLDKILYQLYERPPECYKSLLETPGVGPSTLRALAMVAEVTHGALPSFQDPVRYTFAHGGKDNYPFPVQRVDLTHSLAVLRTAITKAKLGEKDKLQAFKKLAQGEEQLMIPS
ncbi:MAG: DUF763 domain-containing protein [Desulfitobacteriaceae bacterium]|nr:DUF763 domain-containing protein [Desulfitobacteriaceae bacterium]MDD4346827.1 DUF763 domain-containing protein [Desulfitobacteriaceae bacterium]MDD4402151.1 DUF763 domain-containing protein [Desulfitobacteriaceae bacterium]